MRDIAEGWTPKTGQPILVGGQWQESEYVLESRTGWSDVLIGSTFEANDEQYDQAVEAAVEAFKVTRRLASFERGEILRRVGKGILEVEDEMAALLAMESGKPLADALTEVRRTALAFRLGGEEAERIYGEVIPLDLIESARGRWGVVRRMPLGAIAAITPFNVPLNLAAHKLAPALAAGNTIVLKPPSKVALTLLMLGEILCDAGVPPGAVSILPMNDQRLGWKMVEDERFRMLTFTGSAAVGWEMRARAGTKRVTLELGGNAAVIVDESADVEFAVGRILTGAFKNAGQLCISVQRCLVHAAIWDDFVDTLVSAANELTVGDPFADASIGPMISVSAAETFAGWVKQAVKEGATVLSGGTTQGAFASPTVLQGVSTEGFLCTEEAFAPVLVLSKFEEFCDAVDEVNASKYGLQAGVFTRDVSRSWEAFEELDVGAVVVNDIPTFRVDNMPYGGAKQSGLGREGLRYSIEDMTELRMLVHVPEAP